MLLETGQHSSTRATVGDGCREVLLERSSMCQCLCGGSPAWPGDRSSVPALRRQREGAAVQGACWDTGLGVAGAGDWVYWEVFSIALAALWQRGRCGRLCVPAVTLWACGMLRGMLLGCAEMLGGSSKMQL